MTGSSEGFLAGATVESPLGRLTVVASGVGVREIVLPGAERAGRDDTACRDITARQDAEAMCQVAVVELGEYFEGMRTFFGVPVDLRGTTFQLAAWEALRAIPFGAVSTYGEQARLMGRSGAARAVGAANGRNPVPIIVPCHRVIGADGSLVGYAAQSLGDRGLAMKSWLLEHERSVIGRGGPTGVAFVPAKGTVGS